MVKCELFADLLRRFGLFFIVDISIEEVYFEAFVDELFRLLPDESESRLTGTTWCLLK